MSSAVQPWTLLVPRQFGSTAAAASSKAVVVCSSASARALAPSSAVAAVSGRSSGRLSVRRRPRSGEWRWQAVAEQLQAAATEETTSEEGELPSDSLSIFFEAEGSLPEASVASLTSALENLEGVSAVRVSTTSDATATVTLTKQMTVQETGVASSLVDVLLKGGFKVQALNLGFDEQDGDDDDLYDYDTASSTEALESEQES